MPLPLVGGLCNIGGARLCDPRCLDRSPSFHCPPSAQQGRVCFSLSFGLGGGGRGGVSAALQEESRARETGWRCPGSTPPPTPANPSLWCEPSLELAPCNQEPDCMAGGGGGSPLHCTYTYVCRLPSVNMQWGLRMPAKAVMPAFDSHLSSVLQRLSYRAILPGYGPPYPSLGCLFVSNSCSLSPPIQESRVCESAATSSQLCSYVL